MKRQPVHVIRLGLIKVSVWRKRTRSGIRHAVTIARLYRNGDVWKQSSRYGRDDIPQVRLALDRAYEWIYRNGREKEPVRN